MPANTGEVTMSQASLLSVLDMLYYSPQDYGVGAISVVFLF